MVDEKKGWALFCWVLLIDISDHFSFFLFLFPSFFNFCHVQGEYEIAGGQVCSLYFVDSVVMHTALHYLISITLFFFCFYCC